MTRLHVLAGLVSAGVVVALTTPSAQQQTFRASADVVIVDVSVRQGGQPVTGLTGADFVVLDNGVRQEVERVDATSVPIDLTVVTDVSYKHAEVLKTLRSDLTQLSETLRPFDRIRVLVFDDHVREVVPFQPADRPVEFTFDPKGHQASLADAALMALATPVEPDRRHVVILRTRGTDTISLTAIARLRDVAATSDAQLHIVFDEMTVWEELTFRAFQCGKMDRCLPTHNFWQPFRQVSQVVREGRLIPSPYGLLLEEAAVTTGGRVHATELFRAPSLRSTFEKVFETFRQSYVLRYVPKGVARDGWHTITVTVPSQRRAVIRARRGYGVDPPAAVTATRLWLPDNMPPALRQLVLAFDTQQHPVVTRALATERDVPRLIEAFRDAANPWPTEPWRDAVFALELAESVVFSSAARTRTAGLDLLDTHGRLIRHPYEADAFERYWHWAAIAMAQGTMRAAETRRVLDAARLRFPDEPRFVLGRAIAGDQEWTFRDPRTLPRGQAAPSFSADVEPSYRAALEFTETADEARVRLAWGLHRQRAYADALVLLRQTSVSDKDVVVAYLRHLFEGHSLAALKRHADAIASYREAIRWLPTAQSARVSLMNTLLVTGNAGDRIEAEALAEAIQTERTPVTDPWWTYWQGDYRFYSSLIQHLREWTR